MTGVYTSRNCPAPATPPAMDATIRARLHEAYLHLQELHKRVIAIRSDMTGDIEPSAGDHEKDGNSLSAMVHQINRTLHGMASNLSAVEREVAQHNR